MSEEYQRETAALDTVVPLSPTAGSIADILSKAAGARTFDKSTDSLEAIYDKIAALTLLSKSDRARLDLDFNAQSPLIETLRGYNTTDTTIAANSSITSVQVTGQCARYPGAVAWATKLATGTVALNLNAANLHFLILSGATAGNYASLGAFYPISIRGPQYATYFPSDERFVFECLLVLNVLDANFNATTFFAGIAIYGPNDAWTAADTTLYTSDTPKRIGFVGSGGANKNVYGISSDGTVEATTAFAVTLTTYQHFKFVYDIGTGVEFFYNGVSKGTLSTRLPVSGAGAYNAQYPLIPLFVSYNLNSGNNNMMALQAVRCYFQNGA